MAGRLKILVPPVWEQWAEKQLRFDVADIERPVLLRDCTPLPSPSGRTVRAWSPRGHILPIPVGGGARLFDDASSQYLENDTAPVTAAAFTMACWGNSDDATALQAAMWLGDKDVTNHSWGVAFAGSVAGDPIRYRIIAGGASVVVDTTSGYTAGTWAHAAGVETSATDHRALINGGSAGSSTTSRAPSGSDRIAIGRLVSSTPGNYFSGLLAEAAVWDEALSDANVALLAKAVSPLLVRPAGLVFYCPIVGRYSPEIDLVGGVNMTVTGAVNAVHPRIFYPAAPRQRAVIVAAGGADVRNHIIPAYMRINI